MFRHYDKRRESLGQKTKLLFCGQCLKRVLAASRNGGLFSIQVVADPTADY